LFEWMISRFPLMNNFRPSAHQALQKAFKRGRLKKIGSKYHLNPAWSGGSTSRRTTRRPQVAGGAAPPVIPFTTRVSGISWPSATPVRLPAASPPHSHAESIPPSPLDMRILQTAPTSSTPSVPAAALLQAIAGINGIIGEGEDDAEGEGEQQTSPERREIVRSGNSAVQKDDGLSEGGLDEMDGDEEMGEESGPAVALKESLMALAAQLKMAAAASASAPPATTISTI